MAIQSMSRRSRPLVFNTSPIRANAVVLRAFVSLTASNAWPSVTTATLRRAEENSSARIFITNPSRRLAQRFDPNRAIKPSRRKGRGAACEPALDPFNYNHDGRIINDLFQPRSDHLAGAIQPVKIEVGQRHSPACVLVHERERRRENRIKDSEALCDPLDELRLSRAELPRQAKHPAGLRLAAPLPAQCERFLRPICDAL